MMISNPNKKLFLLDAMALIYRAYFAFSKNPRYNSKGLNTSAILGFTNTLAEVLIKQQPTHIAVAFDTAAPTSRHDEFTAYKAHREAMPEDIALSIPYIMEIIRAFNIPVIMLDGYEADDIIGTLAKKGEAEGFTTFMMTPDKDFAQLVSENIYIFKPARMGNDIEILGIPEVLKKYEIEHVDQVRDLLGLWGDVSDNIPGIPGVGEKTAKLLIAQFGSIENMIARSAELKDKLREKVETHASQALLSKRLATIICDVPVEFEPDKLIRSAPNGDKLKEIFNELEFRTLAKRILGEAAEPEKKSPEIIKESKPTQQLDLFNITVSEVSEVLLDVSEIDPDIDLNAKEIVDLQTIHTVPHTYHLIQDASERASLIGILQQQPEFCFDTETTNIDANNAFLVGLSISFKPHEAYYIPFPDSFEEAQILINEFKPLFENPNIEKIGQNLKYDITVLNRYAIEIKGKLFDTMLAHYLIEPDMRHNMNILAENYLRYSPVPIESLIGLKKSEQINMREVPLEKICEYACEDADITLQLKHILNDQLKAQGLSSLFEKIEVPLIHVLVAMETSGIAIDKEFLKGLSKDLELSILEIEKEIFNLSGCEFNIASPKQLGDILFDVLKIDPKAKKTKTGQYATGEDLLSKLTGKHPVIDKILDYRELVKLKNTYVDTLPKMENQLTQRVHTSFNQAVASTGRLSSTNPNVQNIPIRTEKGKAIRKAFISRNTEHILVSADYSQIELRIVAEISKDPNMLEAFLNKQDIHAATAARVYGLSLEEVTPDMRRNAKMVNFGIIYGISAFGLAQRLNIPRKEAGFIIDQYFTQYPSIKKLMDDNINLAREYGYVETLMGRKRYIKDINSQNAIVRGYAERNAINAPIQGTAADMIKIAMINIHQDLREQGFLSKMTLQVHDELVFDVHVDEIELIKPIISHRMKTAISMVVPIEVSMGSGLNWLEAH
jgi:DNA polymerase-1